MARGLIAALEGDQTGHERYAFALAVSEGLLSMRHAALSAAQTAALVKGLVEGLGA